ncbi:MAG: hypothetical protein ACE5K7_01720, partial [Phycisphaerae bacterium]
RAGRRLRVWSGMVRICDGDRGERRWAAMRLAGAMGWLRRAVLGGVVCAVVAGGCGVPQYEKLLDEISLKQLGELLADESLDDEQRAQALRDAGIEDELLIELLLSLDDQAGG